MSDFSRRAVAWALTRQGLPYLWGGNGLVTWTPKGMVPTRVAASCDEGYDCAGLVKAAVYGIGGPDVRAQWSCQELFDFLPPPDAKETRRLRFFGPDNGHVKHVAFELGGGYQLEAAGGDSSTKSYTDAIRRGAKVSVRDEMHGRSDFLGYRSLAAMQFIPNLRAPQT